MEAKPPAAAQTVSLAEALAQAEARLRAGDAAGAAELYRAILHTNPGHVGALRELAGIELRLGRRHRAARLLEQAAEASPADALVQLNLGSLRAGFGDQPAALRHYGKAIELQPTLAEAYGGLAEIFLGQRRLRDAETVARRAIGLKPELTEARFTLGRALAGQGRIAEAEPEFRRVVAERPAVGFAHLHLASAQESPAAAAASYREALARDPSLTPVHRMLGAAVRLAEGDAAAIPHLQRAVALVATDVEAWALLGLAQTRLDRPAAVASLERALALDPQHLGALKHRLDLAQNDGDFTGAQALLARLLAALPERLEREHDPQLLCEILYLDAHMPMPRDLTERIARRLEGVLAGRVRAFGALSPAPTAEPKAKLRIGYLSENFGDHPIGHCTLLLFPAHDRARFEIHGFSLRDRAGEPAGYAARHRAGFDAFHDVSRMTARETALAVRAAGIDILVDLDGYVGQRTPEILAYAPAPLHAIVLANATGLNLSETHWLVSDAIVIPPEEGALHRERIVRLPDTMHCADRPEIGPLGTRADHGLPETGFVFAGIARPDKLDAAIVDCWLRILGQVEGSWLLMSQGPPGTGFEAAMRARAAAAGIDPGRLLFARRVPDKAAHLARYGHCGLLLDTPVFNAATTALDALWAGLPLVALKGDREGSRVSASLLSALGMPELICGSMADYEARAVALARDPAALAAVTARLAVQRDAAALFDIDRFARALEAAYETIWALAAGDVDVDGATPQ